MIKKNFANIQIFMFFLVYDFSSPAYSGVSLIDTYVTDESLETFHFKNDIHYNSGVVFNVPPSRKVTFYLQAV